MANHGYVYTKQEITQEQLMADLQQINNDFLGGLFTITNNDNFFVIVNPDFSDLGCSCWISDEKEYGEYIKSEDAEFPEEGRELTYVEYDEPKLICANSKIEFRHGHGSSFFWWLEGLFRENLAKKYNAEVGDDGYEERYPAKPEQYETFEIYNKSKQNSFLDFLYPGEDQKIKDLYKQIAISKRQEK